MKYFNAETHEEKRFEIALNAYKQASVNVAQGLVTLNISQSSIITLGLCSTLLLANYFIEYKKISVGDFVMFNSFNQ